MTDLELVEHLKTLRLNHHQNSDDDFYSCASLGLGWADHTSCDCGAQEHNTKLDAILDALETRTLWKPND
jgi:hypothetical protein